MFSGPYKTDAKRVIENKFWHGMIVKVWDHGNIGASLRMPILVNQLTETDSLSGDRGGYSKDITSNIA